MRSLAVNGSSISTRRIPSPWVGMGASRKASTPGYAGTTIAPLGQGCPSGRRSFATLVPSLN